jgi:succinate dehydrogenase / fumarate reductase iron-sulfur subunit
MIARANTEFFGNCTNIGECTGVCPKKISLEVIAIMNRDYLHASLKKHEELEATFASTAERIQTENKAPPHLNVP